MADKIQGEGDYEAARRYDEHTRKFVATKQARGEPLEADGKAAADELTPEEREALTHAKHPEQDERDAALLRDREAKR